MRVYVDDSGDFGWKPAQVSLHCGVIVCSSSLVQLFKRHLDWKTSVIGAQRRREIKANELSDDQLESFVRIVILPEANLKLTVVGVDTSRVGKKAFEDWRDDISALCLGAADWSGSKDFPIAARQYTEMSGWLWHRSAENSAMLMSLAEVVRKSLQDSILWFYEPRFEAEFDDFEFVIDQGFIRRREHELFWRELLRTYLTNRFRREPLGTPADWKKTAHIFERKYSDGDDQLNMTPLFRNHMYFSDSKGSEGLQVADVCAHICLRYHRRKQWYPAYRLLSKFITAPRPMVALIPSGRLNQTSKAPTEVQQKVLDYAKKAKPRSRRG